MGDTQRKVKLIDEAIDSFRHCFGLPPWYIEILLEKIPDTGCMGGKILGLCKADPSTMNAQITIDPDQTDYELVKTTRHELIHILLSPIELTRRAYGQILNDEQMKIVGVVEEHSAETCVRSIEFMLDFGLGLRLRLTDKA